MKRSGSHYLLSFFLCLLFSGCAPLSDTAPSATLVSTPLDQAGDEWVYLEQSVLGYVRVWKPHANAIVVERIGIDTDLLPGTTVGIVDKGGRFIAEGRILESTTRHFFAVSITNIRGEPQSGNWVILQR